MASRIDRNGNPWQWHFHMSCRFVAILTIFFFIHAPVVVDLLNPFIDDSFLLLQATDRVRNQSPLEEQLSSVAASQFIHFHGVVILTSE
jgi:hypothetical protein